MTTTIDNSFGALLIGVVIAVFLFGIVTLQVHLYFSQFAEDRKVFKALVSFFVEFGRSLMA